MTTTCTNHPDTPAVAPLCPACATAYRPAGARLVTLCGSMAHADALELIAQRHTLAGDMVLRPEVNMRAPHPRLGRELTEADKRGLDELHLRKIDAAELVVIVTKPDGSLGESTAREHDYARAQGKPLLITRPDA